MTQQFTRRLWQMRQVSMDRRVKPGGDEGARLRLPRNVGAVRNAILILPRLRGRGTAERRWWGRRLLRGLGSVER